MSKTKAMFLDLLPVLMANPFENYESAMRVFCLIDEPMDDLLVLLKNLIKSQRQDKKPLSREVTEYLHRFHPSLAS